MKINCKGNKLKKTKKQKGGRYLSRGSYGCVIKPAVSCPNTLKKIKNIDLNRYVSKIIKKSDNELNNEIYISNILTNVDKTNKYFVLFVDNCEFTDIPKRRTNLAKAIIFGKKPDEYIYTNNRPKTEVDPNFCPVDFSLKPINVIMPFAGYDLYGLATYTKTFKNDKAKRETLKIMNQLFIQNLQYYIKHLILGLITMHNHRVIQRDIKQKNILVGLDSSLKQIYVRYADFGLSEFLSADYIRHTSNIRYRGTEAYIPPEIYASYVINNKLNNLDLAKIKYVEMVNNAIDKLYTKHLNYPQGLNGFTEARDNIFTHVLNLFKTDKILPAYFGSDKNKFNGFLQKGDVYGLGACIFETLKEHKEHIDPKYQIPSLLMDLLLNMLKHDPRDRYNAVQCLNHPFIIS
jgi:serine/threonine protein kinase